nr:cyclophilin-like fold protein [Extibacter muris]
MSVPLSRCGSPAQTMEDGTGGHNDSASDTADSGADTENVRQISVRGSDGQNIVFQLNGSSAAESLYSQLPLTVQVENYSDNEKIFYPPDELDTSGSPLAEGPAGVLAYYEPWKDVVMFYGRCDGAAGLYELGDVISGADQIERLHGEIRIESESERKDIMERPDMMEKAYRMGKAVWLWTEKFRYGQEGS